MQSEIGSNFWIRPEDISLNPNELSPNQFGCEGSDYVWMSTGRSATSFVLDTIEKRNAKLKKVAVIPPFTCHTVIEPFIAKGYEIHTFHINRRLMADSQDILKIVRDVDAGVFLFHRYFGRNTISDIESIISELERLGVVVIEDCTQNLYSTFKTSDADYFVGSIRKWCGVPDGGFAVSKEGQFENKPQGSDNVLEDAKIKAAIYKYEYLFEGKGNKQVFLNCYRKAEDILDNQEKYYCISETSAAVQSNLDVEDLVCKRRKNYKTIALGLKYINGIEVIWDKLYENEVPLYCPIFCKERSKVQSFLVNNKIYAPVVWPKADCSPIVDEDADYVYDHILCIPIDQRYDSDDMERIISVFKENM